MKPHFKEENTVSVSTNGETVVYSQRALCCWTPTQGDHKAVRQGRPTSRGSSPLVDGRFIKRRRMFVSAYGTALSLCVCQCLARRMTGLAEFLACGAKPGASSAIKRTIVRCVHTHTHSIAHPKLGNTVTVRPHKWWKSHCGCCSFHVKLTSCRMPARSVYMHLCGRLFLNKEKKLPVLSKG